MKRDAVLVAVFSLLTIVLYFIPTGFEERYAKNSVRCRGRIIEVDNSEVLQTGIVKMGIQNLHVKLLDGPYAGTEVEAENRLIGKMELDKLFSEDDIAMMVFMAQGIPVVNLLNLNYVSAEILHTLVGSFGLVSVTPFTAFVGAFIYTRRSDEKRR